jgi:uncharacterized damage-inducible protein DinB
MTARPQPDEVAPYFFTYIDQVVTDDPFKEIKNQLEDCRQFFSTISEEKSQFRYAPGKWSVREVLSHITDTERAFVFRALWFARGFDTPLPSYDQEISAAGANAESVSWSAHVEEFIKVRLATVSFFRNLPSGAWMRKGIAGGNPFTVRALAFIIPGHVTHHLKILRERYM